MIIDGRQIAAERAEKLKLEVAGLNHRPCLAVILVGNDKPSEIYVSMKAKKAEELGIGSEIIKLDRGCTDRELILKIVDLNNDPGIDGILVQLPFPTDSASEANEREILDAIDPKKDVDGLTSANLGLLFNAEPRFYPATVRAILLLLEKVLTLDFFGRHTSYRKIKYLLAGKHVTIVGRSQMVGKPLSAALINFGATVTVCNARTLNLKMVTKPADILITAVGAPNLITKDMVKSGAIVIDAGISQDALGKTVGDVDFPNVEKVAGAITPVPGGVGPVTNICILENTIEAATMFSSNMVGVI